jgi:hypothetical protein
MNTKVKNNRLAPILNQYKELDLGPDQLSGLEMGYVYEELLRRFSEQSGEEAGEHFTPREVIRLNGRSAVYAHCRADRLPQVADSRVRHRPAADDGRGRAARRRPAAFAMWSKGNDRALRPLRGKKRDR